MNRRSFLQLSSAASMATTLPMMSFMNAPNPKFKLGYQLFSIRDAMAEDPIATLKALKKMGYEDFEHYGFDADKNTYYGFPIKEFKTRLDDLGLTFSSGHYVFSPFIAESDDTFKQFLDACIEGALIMNSNYITWPIIGEEFRTVDGFKKAAEKINLAGEHVSKAGLGFAYHNHGYEFDLLDDSQTGYEIIVTETDPTLVKLQMDMYWVMHAQKTTPKKLVEEHPNRYVMWHLKDMHKVSRDYTELGNGSIDYTSILPDPFTTGLEFFYIEQGGNFTENSTKSAEFSANYYKQRLAQYF